MDRRKPGSTVNIVNVGYDSTNYYVLSDRTPILLVDAGWPGTLAKLQHECQRMNIALRDIKHFLVTHFHPDHAGLAEELKQMGSKLIVMEDQIAFLKAIRNDAKLRKGFIEIKLDDNIVVSLAESRAFLAELGIQGETMATPGHSDDSVSLILDEGIAFTGDLTHPMLSGDDPESELSKSWGKIRAAGVKQIYPAHGPVWRLS